MLLIVSDHSLSAYSGEYNSIMPSSIVIDGSLVWGIFLFLVLAPLYSLLHKLFVLPYLNLREAIKKITILLTTHGTLESSLISGRDNYLAVQEAAKDFRNIAGVLISERNSMPMYRKVSRLFHLPSWSEVDTAYHGLMGYQDSMCTSFTNLIDRRLAEDYIKDALHIEDPM